MFSPRLAPPVVRGLESAAGDRPSSPPTSALGSELSIVRSSKGTDPEGVLLNIDTPGSSWLREPADGAPLSIVRSAPRSKRGAGWLPDDDFGCCLPFKNAPPSLLPLSLSTLGRSRASPQRWQRTASAGFSPLQEGQIMIEGWLDVSYAGDYPARLSPSASNICGNSIDTNTKDAILRMFTALIGRWN